MDLDSFVRRPGSAVTIAVLAPVVVGAALYLFHDGFSQAVAAVVFALTVSIVALTGNRLAGLVSAVTSAVWFDFFFTQPYLSFTIHDLDDVELALVLVAVGALVTELAVRAQRARADAGRQAGYLEGLVDLANAGDPGEGGTAVADRAARAIAAILGADRVRYVGAAVPTNVASVDRTGVVRLGDRTVDLARDGLPTETVTAIPISPDGGREGYFEVVTATRVRRPTVRQLHACLLAARDVGSRLRA